MTSISYDVLPIIACPVCDHEQFTAVTTRFDGGRIVQCKQCGHMYLNPTLTDAILQKIYGEEYFSQDESQLVAQIDSWVRDPHGPYVYALNLLERRGGLSKKHVLEVGCGTGRFLLECQRHGAHITGIDPSPHGRAIGKKHFGLEIIPATLEQAIAEHVIEPASCDVVCAFEVIEHVTRPQQFIDMLARLLVPGGYLILSTPNFYLFRLMGDSAPAVRNWPEHLHFFEPRSLEALLQRSGLRIIDVTTLAAMNYSQRTKQQIAQKRHLMSLWKIARRMKALRHLKDTAFMLLERRRRDGANERYNGAGLVGIAQKSV